MRNTPSSPVLPLHSSNLVSRHTTPTLSEPDDEDNIPVSSLPVSPSDSHSDIGTAVNPSHSELSNFQGRGPTDGLEKEMNLKEKTRETGEIAHVPPGSKERRETVDLGRGMEEVIVIEWLKGDPEAGNSYSFPGRN